MDQITTLLEQLANKLGTTTTYLWGVLLKQAPISAVIDIIQYIIVGLACFGWFKLTIKFNNRINNDELDETHYYWIGAVWLFLGILTICVFFSIDDIITALVNPEYWALNKILSKISR